MTATDEQPATKPADKVHAITQLPIPTKKISSASSDDEFAAMLAEAFKMGDFDSFRELRHSATPNAIDQRMQKLIKPAFGIKPDSVSYSFTTLSKVNILPGSIGGKNLVYTTAVDGVIHLVGKSQTKLGESSFELFVPFHKSKGGYQFPACDYADKTTTAEQPADGKEPEAAQQPH